MVCHLQFLGSGSPVPGLRAVHGPGTPCRPRPVSTILSCGLSGRFSNARAEKSISIAQARCLAKSGRFSVIGQASQVACGKLFQIEQQFECSVIVRSTGLEQHGRRGCWQSWQEEIMQKIDACRQLAAWQFKKLAG